MKVHPLLLLLLLGCSPAEEPEALAPLPRPSFGRLDYPTRLLLETERERIEKRIEAEAAAEPYGELAGLYLAHDFRSAAASFYREASRLDPHEFRWPYLRGIALQRDTRLAEASGCFDEALGLRPFEVPALLRQAQVQLELGDFETALGHAKTATEQDPGLAAAWFELGLIELQSGSTQAAVEALERSLQIDPASDAVHSSLAQGYRKLGELDLARQHLGGAGRTRPHFPDPLFDELAARFAGAEVHLAQGDRAMVSGRAESAIAHYRRAIELEPENGRALHNLGAALGRVGRDNEGLSYLQRASELQPDDRDIHFDLATARARLGQLEEAEDGFARVLELTPDDREARRRRAQVRSALGRRELAAAELQGLVETDSGDLGSRLLLAHLERQLGRTEASLELYREALSIDPEHVPARLSAASLLVASGRHSEAEALLAADPTDSDSTRQALRELQGQ